ncbi:uncharacterized protein LOC111604928 [Drosophila hydei]|uniref:Uncharacterized protein LOC111604928 n=1 Tax=Drosophila hydei TaxID=7224 RepID=A0A6J1MC89_DROHY|nr:uncharacterized protein LOC111604928 [Drosophila hydei]
MSSTKRLSLSQVALQSSCAQNALNSMRRFCQSSQSVATVRQRRQIDCPKGTAPIDKSRLPTHKPTYGGQLSKVIGVKKTLINQMQGMVQKLKPRLLSKGALMSQKGNNSRYQIYGQTRLFSSMSSLASNSNMLQPISKQLRQLQRRRMAAVTIKSVTQQRYNQIGSMQERRNGQLAKDISRSIQSELMEVDINTKRLISCARVKPGFLTNCDQRVEQNEKLQKQQQLQQQHMQLKLHHQQAYQQNHPLRFNPLEGWNHPRTMKPAKRTVDDDYISTQRTQSEKEQEVEPEQLQEESILRSRRLKSKLGELYASSNKMRSNKYRKLQYHNSLPSESALSTMDHNAIHDIANKNEREQECQEPSAFIKRMDDEHYQTKMAGNLMSASQRVFNKRFEGYPDSEARGKTNRLLIDKNAVKPLPPKGQVVTTSASEPSLPSNSQSVPETRPLTARSFGMPVGASVSSTTRVKRAVPKVRSHKKLFKKLGQTPVKSSKADVPQRSSTVRFNNNSNPNLSRPTHANYEQHLRQVCEMPRGPLRMGEMREPQKSDENYTSCLQNDVRMPSEYTKESAVRRLGIAVDRRDAYGSHTFSQQRMHV